MWGTILSLKIEYIIYSIKDEDPWALCPSDLFCLSGLIIQFLLPSAFWLGFASGGKRERLKYSFHIFPHFKDKDLLFVAFFHNYPFLPAIVPNAFQLSLDFPNTLSLPCPVISMESSFHCLLGASSSFVCPLTPTHASVKFCSFKFPDDPRWLCLLSLTRTVINTTQFKNICEECNWANYT